jgi:hypothetical protein
VGIKMPTQCEECNEEKGYDDVMSLKCNLGYEHDICKNCMDNIVKKTVKGKGIHHLNKQNKEKKNGKRM